MLGLTALPAMAQTYTSSWFASSSLYPDQVSPDWTWSADGTASLSGGVLTLSGSNPAYSQHGTSLLVTPIDSLVVEFEMRAVSGSSSEAWRAAAGVRFTTENGGVGNGLFISPTMIFLNQSNGGSGESPADTFLMDATAFHLYRIEVDPDRSIRVFVDGTQRLSGATWVNTSLSQSEAELTWGDLAGAATGVSEWKSFQHTAAIPEPGTVGMVTGLAALGALTAFRRRVAIR
jgi:hypothetical protein